MTARAIVRRIVMTLFLAALVFGLRVVFLGGRPQDFLEIDADKQLQFVIVLPAMLVARLCSIQPGVISFGETWLIVAGALVAVLAGELIFPAVREFSIDRLVLTALSWLCVPCIVMTIISAFKSEEEAVFWLGAALTFIGLRDNGFHKYLGFRIVGWALFLFASWALYWVFLDWFLGLKSIKVPPRDSFVFLAGSLAFARTFLKEGDNLS